jgi:anti-sigma factor RsiW
MNPTDPPASGLPCIDLVQLVTAYLDDALPADMRASVDAHLSGCHGCRNVVAQWRTVIALAGRLTEADVQEAGAHGPDELERDRLLSTFRGLRRR